ncbi:BspA family leucine-rich repeat surface protein [Leyella stercorea]|uniref:BspA family leucine-rich repeat surface protein n=1 Tax=Leyella stercorea TaxID=363265 RepID=UPI002671C965|nr:BspA family leucine-rich repeat surface protein [Leyella stercorea]
MKTKLYSFRLVRFLLAIAICLPVWGSNVFAQTVESYVVLDNAAGTLTFKHDANKPAGAFSLNEGETYPAWYDGDGTDYNKNNIQKVIFDPSFANARPTNCYSWFFGCKDLTTIEGIGYLNTENVTSMRAMFSGCSSLTSLDVSNFKTQNVTNMGYMFATCSALTSLDLSNFNTQNVIDMGFMFAQCQNLTSLNLSNFDTRNVTNMRAMFNVCTGLTSLDLSAFKTHNVTDMCAMFALCTGLSSLDLSTFDTHNVTNMGSMFTSSIALTSLNVSKFNTEKVTNMMGMFERCSNLTSLDVSNFNTQNVTDMWGMFSYCSGLKSLDLSNFDTQNVTDMRYMFTSCVNLATIYASDKFVTTACSEDGEMFSDCKKLVGAVPYDPNRIGKEMANYTTGYFTYKAASGIDAVSTTDNIAAEYYDVNGRRLNAPQKGINIVKRGNRTTKVLVK